MKTSLLKPPTKREVHAEERKNQLIDLALQLFSEKGWENTTIKDLAEAGGVAPGLFYHYFESKEELLFAVFEKYGFNAEIRRLMTPLPTRPASEVLLELAKAYYRLLTEKGPFLRMFVREAMVNPKLNERWKGMCHEGASLITEYLAARVAAGELRPHNTAISAKMLIHPIVMLHLTDAPADQLPELVGCLLDGIRRTK